MKNFYDFEARIDLLGQGQTEACAAASELLALGEEMLEYWIEARGEIPGQEMREGFRLLALHR